MAETPELTNARVAGILRDIAIRLEIKGESPFKSRAYRTAAETIESLGHDLRRDWQAGRLQKIPGIGEAIAGKLDELLRTGQLRYYDKLRKEIPDALVTLTQIPEVGPKTARAIHGALGISTLDELEAAARAERLRQVTGIGPKTEARILAGIETVRRRQAEPQRTLLGVALPRARTLLAALMAEAGDTIVRGEATGSVRRRKATIGDLDLLVASAHPRPIMDAFKQLDAVAEVLLSGDTKTSVRLRSGEQADLRVVPPERWGSALQYFTGSQRHNIELREHALRQGLTLNEYGFKRLDGGEELLCATEEELYELLGMEWIPPELREGRGEIEAARDSALPDLVNRRDLRGDLHMHSQWSDGKGTISEMAEAARAMGYEYIVITDHSHSLGVAGGLDVDRLGQQRIEIVNVNSRFPDIRVLQGIELEIKNDATLDLADDVLEILDVVIASLHTGLRQDRDQVTRRALEAIHNPHVDILAHPTGRLLNRREGADLDIDAVLRAAAETGTVLEVNSQVDRLDLDPIHVREALELGCLISIGSDAHSPEGLDVIEYGVWQARRGWASADDVINTRPLADLLDYIHRLEDDEE